MYVDGFTALYLNFFLFLFFQIDAKVYIESHIGSWGRGNGKRHGKERERVRERERERERERRDREHCVLCLKDFF